MASSQVEIVSSSPFGCVLRNHNRKERCRESTVRAAQAVFEKNFKELVRDHIHDCISLSSGEHSQNQISNVASWIANEQGNGNPHNWRSSNKDNHIHHKKKIKTEELPAITPRQSPVLDRWVTRQAEDVRASSTGKHANEAEPSLVPSNSSTASLITSVASSCRTKTAQNFSTKLENASFKHNLGASSLVQIWEARLNRSNSINSNQNQSQCQRQSMGSNSNTSRTNSGLSCNENNVSPVEEPPTGDSFDEKFDNGTNNEDSLIYWESQSDRTTPGEPPSSCSCSRSFDAGESERVRIADIIKRLTNGREVADDHEHSNNFTELQCREHKHSSTSDQAEQRCFSQVVNSPRLRGRQAFNDLLVQIERDKNRELDSLAERQSVSKFSQRGRLQSMLRLRCLQRSVTIQDKCRPQSPAAHVNRVPQGSSIMHLREKFSTGIEQNDSATPKWLHREVSNNSIQLDKSSISKPQNEGTHCQKVSFAGNQSALPVNPLKMNTNEDLRKQTKSDARQQKISLEARCIESLKTTKATTSLEGQSENYKMAKKQGFNSHQPPFLDSPETAEPISFSNVYTQNEIAKEQNNHHHHPSLDLQETIETTTSLNSSTENEIAEEQDIGDQQHLCLFSQEIVENATPYNDRDENEITAELEDDYQQYFPETNYDWFSNISRPRSYWEGLRQEWYQEVLNTTSKNEEIRQLLERGRVSTFLASDFRERMDQLMISRMQIQADRTKSQEEVDDEDVQPMSYLQRHLHPAAGKVEKKEENGGVQEVDGQEEEEVEEVAYEEEEEEEEQEEDNDDDDDDDERSPIRHQFHEANHYFNQSSSSMQMPSLSLMRSWSFQDDNEIGNDSDLGPSTFSTPPGPSQEQYYDQDARQSSSSINRPSLEMELICDLRGHIEQLHHEMDELRKSVLSYMDMQMKLQQHSLNREVHSVVGEGKNSADRSPWERSCCICYEMQVDSLLYRCGHMCTCLKCAQELQWSSGKCPICGAPILDVVPPK